jgi:hypothetical protein
MIPYEYAGETVAHGGDLDAARRLFPGAVEPFIDLSTGINPNPYPLQRLSADLFARLPPPAAAAALAAQAYGAPSTAHVVPAPGTQILLPLVAALIPPGRAALLTPSYGEFARAAALAGHRVKPAHELDACADADLVMIANPNNPDGTLTPVVSLQKLPSGKASKNAALRNSLVTGKITGTFFTATCCTHCVATDSQRVHLRTREAIPHFLSPPPARQSPDCTKLQRHDVHLMTRR